MPTTSQVLAGAAVGLVAGVAAARRRAPDPAPPAPVPPAPCRSCLAAGTRAAHYKEQAEVLRAQLYGPRPEPEHPGRFQWAAR